LIAAHSRTQADCGQQPKPSPLKAIEQGGEIVWLEYPGFLVLHLRRLRLVRRVVLEEAPSLGRLHRPVDDGVLEPDRTRRLSSPHHAGIELRQVGCPELLKRPIT